MEHLLLIGNHGSSQKGIPDSKFSPDALRPISEYSLNWTGGDSGLLPVFLVDNGFGDGGFHRTGRRAPVPNGHVLSLRFSRPAEACLNRGRASAAGAGPDHLSP